MCHRRSRSVKAGWLVAARRAPAATHEIGKNIELPDDYGGGKPYIRDHGILRRRAMTTQKTTP
jgi:hypothetical protein